MKRGLLAAFGLLAAIVFALPADAQTTIVSGTIHDPAGLPYALGSVKAQLVLAGSSVTGQPTVTVTDPQQCRSAGQGSAPCQVPFQGTVGPFTMDSNGVFTVALQDNSLVMPAGTQWLFTVTESPGIALPFGYGPQTFSVAVTITGVSQDVSATLNTVAKLLARFAGLQQFNGVPTGACTTGQLAVDITTGILYTCNAGTWTPGSTSSGAGPPVGACTGNQVYLDTTTGSLYTCNGGVWTPSTTGGGSFSYSETGLDALFSSSVSGTKLTQTANPTMPGMALMGPVPPVSGSNSFFDHATAASGNSATITVSGSPSAATGSVLFFASAVGQSSPPPAPAGFSVFDSAPNGNAAAIYSNTYSSTATQTVTSSITSNVWQGALAFFGGTIGTVTVKQTNSGGFPSGCTTTSAFTPTANHTQLTFVEFSSGAASSVVYQVTDSAGDVIVPIMAQQQSSPSILAQYGFLAQNVAGSSRTVTVCFSSNVSAAVIRTYDVAGLTSFYSGTVGPWNFRFITAQDLLGVNGGLGFTKIQIQTAVGCTVATTSTYDVCKQNITWQQPFIDTNYQVWLQCKDGQPAAGSSPTNDSLLLYLDTASFTTTNISVITQNNRSIAQTCPTIQALGIHP